MVKQLLEPFCRIERNITADNYFTDCILIEELYRKRLIYVGTVRKTQRDIPEGFTKVLHVVSCCFALDQNVRVVSFIPKKNKGYASFNNAY